MRRQRVINRPDPGVVRSGFMSLFLFRLVFRVVMSLVHTAQVVNKTPDDCSSSIPIQHKQLFRLESLEQERNTTLCTLRSEREQSGSPRV